MSRSYHHELGQAVSADVEAVSFFSSIFTGFLLGLGLDAWLDTKPAFIIVGIIVGSVSGYWRLWQVARRETEKEQPDARRR